MATQGGLDREAAMRRITALLALSALFVPVYATAENRLRAQPLPDQPLPGGFDWHDALVGGAAVAGVVLILIAAIVARRTRSHGRRGTLACLAATVAIAATVGSATAAAAGPEYKNFTTLPFSEANISCSGETVEVFGVIRHHVVFVNDGAGGFHGNGLFNAIAKGTSSSGTRYVASFTDHLIQYIGAGELPVAVTSPFSFRLISNDGTPNLYVRGNFHITIAATGSVTSVLDEFEIECR